MIHRDSTSYVLELSRHFPVLFITGPRQSGKTTLAKLLFPDLPYSLLELPDVLQFAKEDPRTFLSQYPGGAVLDEVQNAPELFSYLQGTVDENPSLKFILTGSQNFLMNERISQSLAGRAGVITLLPLSLRELKSQIQPSAFLDWIFKGFYPGLHQKNTPAELFYPSYVQTYLERDVRSLKQVGDLAQFNLFLKLCAGRVGQLLNLSSLSVDVGISVNTVKAWISVLEASYIIYRLQPHYKNYNKRLVKSPKLYFTDPGLVCHLLGIRNKEQLSTHFALGALFENLIIMEVLKHRLNKGEMGGLYFWRDQKGVEIDLIIEKGEGQVAIEIKASRTMRQDYFSNLSAWSKLSGLGPENCKVIYGGDINQTTPHGQLIGWKSLVNSADLFA